MTPTKTPARTLRVLLADDQLLFRDAVAALIDAQPDFDVVGMAANGIEAVELSAGLAPDVVLLDVEMPVMGGLEAAELILRRQPGSKVVILTVSDDEEDLLTAVRAGAQGYLLKDMHPAQLFEMIRAVADDQTPVSPSLMPRLLAEVRESGQESRPVRADSPDVVLSHRELQVMRLAADGLSNKEIGRRLCITEGTVKNHVHNALHKLQMENRIQAAAYIVRQGYAVQTP